MKTFPFEAVYARLSARLDHATAASALLHAEHYWRANADRCTVASLCWVGLRRVRQQVRRDRRIGILTDTDAARTLRHVRGVEFTTSVLADLAVARVESTSEGLDDLLSGLTGRDREIAALWSEGLRDIDVADRLGCSVKTVERTRKTLAVRLS